MGLAFLVPLALAAAVAVAIPIVVHLTRRRRSKVLPFPSIRFIERVPYRVESRRRIHHWFLLTLRALAILLIVAAFARPFVDRSAEAEAAGTGPTERVVLLDRSWSMALGERWSEAQDAAREAVSELGPLDRASVVLFARGADAVARSTSEPRRLREAIDTARVSDQATAYGPGLKLTETILAESELPGREVVIISDFQAEGWTGDEGVVFPPGTRIRTVTVGEGPIENATVAEVALNRRQVEGRERVSPSARLTRTGGTESREVEVALSIDRQTVQTRRVTLPPEGASAVAFDPVTLGADQTQGSISLTPDALPHDDIARFVLSPGRAQRVQILVPARGAARSFYLERALEITEAGDFEVVSSTGSVPSGDALDAVDVLIMVGRPLGGGAEMARVTEWVREGGGLVLVAGEAGGWGAGGEAIFPGALGGTEDREGRGERLATLDYQHPIFERFRGPRQGDFSAARFYRARRLDVQPSDVDSVAILARFDDGSVALAERRSGDGRVLVWASTLDAEWTDLALQPVFLPFVHQLVRHASGRTDAFESFTAGQIIDVADGRAMESAGLGAIAEAIAASEERVVLTPSGVSFEITSGEGSHFLELSEAGFYEIRPPGRDDLRPVSVAVNVDRAESRLAPLDPEEMVAAIRNDTDGLAGGIAAERADALRRADQERRQSWWRWLLLGAFGILIMETILSNRLSGRRARSEHARV
ncbi:MAG: BatA domain-containing protein [Longimicrobiales bacterium]|nr:BatA domain-containing protein [Longimicrobiales bacterium]